MAENRRVDPPESFELDDLDRLRSVAEEAAAIGARVVAEADRSSPARSEAKGQGDYVTDVDRRSEVAIRAFLERATPDVPVLGEEEGGRRGHAYWAVDPLD